MILIPEHRTIDNWGKLDCLVGKERSDSNRLSILIPEAALRAAEGNILDRISEHLKRLETSMEARLETITKAIKGELRLHRAEKLEVTSCQVYSCILLVRKIKRFPINF